MLLKVTANQTADGGMNALRMESQHTNRNAT
jgi:hypothetical protein